MLLIKKLQERLTNWQEKKLQRILRPLTRVSNAANLVQTATGTVVDFTSNDYLGLHQHPEIAAKFSNAALQYGFGSGSASMIAGFTPAHQEFEQQFAAWLGVERTLLFSSGYLANVGVIGALVGRNSNVIADKYCHASILDGIQLARAKLMRYQHNDVDSLKRLAKKNCPDLVITESIFSMEGDLAPIKEICGTVKQSGSGLIIDDAHGIGILGKTGRGVLEHFALQADDYTCIMMPLGKAFNGVGAIVAGSNEVIEAILQFARTYRYNTALPPAVACALQGSLFVVQNDHWRRECLDENIEFFTAECKRLGLPLFADCKTPIMSIIVGTNEKSLLLQEYMLQHGIMVYATRPPTVPENSARLRISLNSLHTHAQITTLLQLLARGIEHGN